MSQGLKTKTNGMGHRPPFGFTPMEPRFGNSLRQFSNPRSTGMKPAGTTF
jgi:hypothetical protein